MSEDESGSLLGDGVGDGEGVGDGDGDGNGVLSETYIINVSVSGFIGVPRGLSVLL